MPLVNWGSVGQWYESRRFVKKSFTAIKLSRKAWRINIHSFLTQWRHICSFSPEEKTHPLMGKMWFRGHRDSGTLWSDSASPSLLVLVLSAHCSIEVSFHLCFLAVSCSVSPISSSTLCFQLFCNQGTLIMGCVWWSCFCFLRAVQCSSWASQ